MLETLMPNLQPILPILLALAALLSLLLVIMGIYRITTGRVDPRDRLDRFSSRRQTLEEVELAQPFSERIIKPMVSALSELIAKRRPAAAAAELEHKLAQAGTPQGLSPADFVAVKFLLAITLGLVAGLLLLRFTALWQALLAATVGGIIGYIAPEFWLTNVMKKRQRLITRQLPDALDLLTISVEAGLGFDSALSKVAQKWSNELSHEFGRTLSEIRMGKTRREALRDLSWRTGVPDLDAVVGAVVQSDQLGIAISKVLRVQSDQMRTVRRQRAEELAHQAPIKMTIPLVFLIFPAMLIVLLGPAALQIMKAFS